MACLGCNGRPQACPSSLGQTQKPPPRFRIHVCKSLPRLFLQWNTNNRVPRHEEVNSSLGNSKRKTAWPHSRWLIRFDHLSWANFLLAAAETSAKAASPSREQTLLARRRQTTAKCLGQ